MNPANRLNTCKHVINMPRFQLDPHGNTHDFKRYPLMWLASKGMILLLAGFHLFWTTILWFCANRQDLQNPLPQSSANPKKSFMFADLTGSGVGTLSAMLVVMVLSLTGTSVLYADISHALVTS